MRLAVFSSRVTPVTDTVAGFTVTVQVSVWFPSAVTVITAVPAPTAVTTPLFTVATWSLLVVHVTFLFVAFSGATVALRVSVVVSPIVRLAVFSSRVTPVTDTVSALTVTVQVAVLPPSAVTVIVASPAPTAVTFPLWSTVATPGVLLSHVTLLFVAVEGDTVALRFVVSPTLRLTELLSSLTPVTLIPFTVPFPLVFSTVPVPATVTLTSV